MKTRSLVAITLLLFAVLVWFLLKPESLKQVPPIPVTQSAAASATSEIQPKRSQTPTQTAKSPTRPALPYQPSEQGPYLDWRDPWGPFARATSKEVEAFLAAKGHTAANYLAAHELSGDGQWLEEGLRRFPDSLILLVAHGQSAPSESQQRSLDHFKALDPHNSAPWMLSAIALITGDEKQPEKAIQEIQAALGKPSYYAYISERTAAVGPFREFLGRDCLEAEFAYFVIGSGKLPGDIYELGRQLKEAAKAQPSLVDKVIEANQGLVTWLKNPEVMRNGYAAAIPFNLESATLELLPPDTVLPAFGKTVAERQQELRGPSTLEFYKAQADLLYRKKFGLTREYYQRFRDHGGSDTFEWARAQTADYSPPSPAAAVSPAR